MQRRSENKASTVLKTLNIIALLSLIGLFLYYWQNNSSQFFLYIRTIILILLITLFTRSLGTRVAFTVYARGLFIGVGLTLFIGFIYTLLGLDVKSNFASAIFFPIVEETAKLLPVIFSAYLVYRGAKVLINPSDWFMLGSMSGIAFAMSEAYWRQARICWNCVKIYGPHLGNFYLFPDAYAYVLNHSQVLGYIGHSAATGFIAGAIGLGLYLRNYRNIKPIWWILPLLSFVWISFEHIAYNSYHDIEVITKIFVTLNAGHFLTISLCTILIIIILAIDLLNLRKALKNSARLRSLAKYGFKKMSFFIKEKKYPPFIFIVSIFKNIRLFNRAAWFYHCSFDKK